MSNNRFNCCQKLQCAYLILEAKVLGVEPVFGTPTVKIWGSKFQGYTGPLKQGYTGADAITGCGPLLETKVPKYAGVSAGFETWSTPKLLAELPGDNIVWGGKENLKYGDYSYFVKGKFILPSEYAGTTLQNTEVIDDQTYYKMYMGTNSEDLEILKSIKSCFKISRDEVPVAYVPKIIKPDGGIGELCDMTEGATAGIVDIFGSTPLSGNRIDEQYIFDIKVDYSSDFNAYLTDSTSNVFFSVSDIQEIQSGTVKAYCDIQSGQVSMASRELYCKGGTIKNEQRCYNVAPGTQGSTKLTYGYYQSQPKVLGIFRVDLYRCKDENGAPYISIGNIDAVSAITVTPYVPAKTEPKDICEKDFCYDVINQETQNNKNYTGTISRGIGHTNCFNARSVPVCSGVANINRDISWSPSESCKSLTNSTYCPDDPGPYERCKGNPDLGIPPVDCSGRNFKLRFVWRLFNYNDTWNECCYPDGTPYDPPRCGCAKTRVEKNAVDFYESYIRILYPGDVWNGDEKCGKVEITRRPNNCGGEDVFIRETVCGESTFEYPDPCRCDTGSGNDLPEYVQHYLPIQYSYKFKQSPPCPDEQNEREETNDKAYSRIIYNPDRWCWGQYSIPFEARIDRAFCCCPADGPPGGGGGGSNTNNNFIVTVNYAENTTYVINPYIMIDGDPRYFEGPNNSIPNFNKYIQHYLSVWKQDRLNLDETASDYKAYVDNPKCDRGFSTPLHPNFYIFNENKGITSGVKTNTIKCKDGTESYNFYARYTSIPNPDYPCKNIFSFNRFGLCSSPIQIPSFNDISKVYSNLPENKRPECFNKIVDYFNAELLKDSQGNTLYYTLQGVTLNKCTDVHSIDFLNNILKY